jgi:hypothetical protein
MQQLRLFFAMALLRKINAIVASCWNYFTTKIKFHILICGFIAKAARGEIHFSACARHEDVWGSEVTFHSFLTSALDIGERSD